MLLANGHPGAGLYPIGRVWDEARLVAECENRRMATEAVLIQAAVSSVMSKEGGEQFQSLVSKLNE